MKPFLAHSLLAIALMSFLLGCRESDEFPNPKAGAWEITSTFNLSIQGPQTKEDKEFLANSPLNRKPHTSRLCITSDPEELKLRSMIPQLPNCEVTLIKQDRSERAINMHCDKPREMSTAYQFRFVSADEYVESAQGRIISRIGTRERTLLTSNRNVAKYLGADCKRFGAKKITELGAASVLLSQLSKQANN